MRTIRVPRELVVVASLFPVVVAAALVPLRDLVDPAPLAIVVVASVVVVAMIGRRDVAVVAAVLAALAFDFFLTQPYQSIRINNVDELITTVALLAVGLLVAGLGSRRRQAADLAEERQVAVQRIFRAAEQTAEGEDPSLVIISVALDLTDLFNLRDCRFEAEPVAPNLPTIEHDATIRWGRLRFAPATLGLPSKGVALPVHGDGQFRGRFVLVPQPLDDVSSEQLTVALALADQVGASLAGHRAAA